MRPKRRLSAATVIALLALFVALGGVGIAANGQSLILGSVNNSASLKTALAAPVNDRAVQITNTNTGTSATALGLTVGANRPPLIVSSGAGKATNLNADKLDGQEASAFYQPRPAPTSNAVGPRDSTGDVGRTSSATIGADGLGLISYYDFTNHDLKVAHCTDIACSSATTATLDSTGDVGWWGSITIGADGLGLISYLDLTNGDLKVAHCANAACSSATKTTLDSAGQVGWDTSITIGADGLGLVSYLDEANGDLKVAHCANAACSSATKTTLDSAGVVGLYSSATVGIDGLGLISYYDQTNGDLKVARCANVVCSSPKFTPSSLDAVGDVGLYTSATIDANGRGLISYSDATNGRIKAVECAYDGCITAFPAHVVGPGTQSSLTIDPAGLPVVGIYTGGDLGLAYCSSADCSSALRFSTGLDSAGDVGQYPALTIGADGFALVSYYDVTNANLKVAHCSSWICQPYFRRR